MKIGKEMFEKAIEFLNTRYGDNNKIKKGSLYEKYV